MLMFIILINKESKNLQKRTLEEIETRKARRAVLWSRFKWQIGDKCSAEFFRSVRPTNFQKIISVLRDSHMHIFTKNGDLEQICL